MEVRIKISEEIHSRLSKIAKFHDITITAQTKIYITEGLEEDEMYISKRKELAETS